MERVETLVNILVEKLQKKASVNEMLSTVKMLESELQHIKSITAPDATQNSTIAINISKQITPEKQVEEQQLPVAEEEKTVEVLQIDEADLEAELEEIKKTTEERNKFTVQNKPAPSFDYLDDIPTLANRQINTAVSTAVLQPKEIHEILPVNNAASVNETLRTTKNELSDTLQDSPVKDLRKAIGINDRFVYMKELFRGDDAMYERSIKTINAFAIYPEAEYWIRRELKLKLGWDDKNETVKQFDQLVRRRFA